MDTPRYLTLAEAAHELRVEPETLRAWIRAGILRACRTPGRRGRYRVRIEDLDDVLVDAPSAAAGDRGR